MLDARLFVTEYYLRVIDVHFIYVDQICVSKSRLMKELIIINKGFSVRIPG